MLIIIEIIIESQIIISLHGSVGNNCKNLNSILRWLSQQGLFIIIFTKVVYERFFFKKGNLKLWYHFSGSSLFIKESFT